jgi:hypothetical protein
VLPPLLPLSPLEIGGNREGGVKESSKAQRKTSPWLLNFVVDQTTILPSLDPVRVRVRIRGRLRGRIKVKIRFS